MKKFPVNTQRSWWGRVAKAQPEWADSYLEACPTVTTEEGEQPEKEITAFLTLETPPGTAIMDSACNKSLVGEITLEEDEKHLEENFGLCAIREPTTDSFTFGEGSGRSTEVTEQVRRPVGILGHNGELVGSIIPGADTPGLIAKDDL